jgi:hypothetical protein
MTHECEELRPRDDARVRACDHPEQSRATFSIVTRTSPPKEGMKGLAVIGIGCWDGLNEATPQTAMRRGLPRPTIPAGATKRGTSHVGFVRVELTRRPAHATGGVFHGHE